jgi:hypothetical protein
LFDLDQQAGVCFRFFICLYFGFPFDLLFSVAIGGDFVVCELCGGIAHSR